MKIEVDTHSHTLASGHAYSTISEMIAAAREIGLKGLAITEHGPNMKGSCQNIYFHNFRVIPRERYGVTLFMGAEANIIDYEGNLDMDTFSLHSVDLVIASMHMPCVKPGSKEDNTNAMIGAIKNPYVNILGHPDDGRYPVDYEAIVIAAKENNILLELNNSSLNPDGFRKDSRGNDIEMLKYCMKYNAPITVSSDAHIEFDVGKHGYALELLEELNFPEQLVMNTDLEKFKAFIAKKRICLK